MQDEEEEEGEGERKAPRAPVLHCTALHCGTRKPQEKRKKNTRNTTQTGRRAIDTDRLTCSTMAVTASSSTTPSGGSSCIAAMRSDKESTSARQPATVLSIADISSSAETSGNSPLAPSAPSAPSAASSSGRRERLATDRTRTAAPERRSCCATFAPALAL